MTPDEVVVVETRRWLRKVERDLLAVQAAMGFDPPLLDDAAYHCQQAVEKVFKAFLVWHGRSFRKTHVLAETGMYCAEIDPSLLLIVERVRPMSDYSSAFRYPGERDEPTLQEAQRALTIAREVVAAVMDRIPLLPEALPPPES